jgi:hypothetical protein
VGPGLLSAEKTLGATDHSTLKKYEVGRYHGGKD